MDSDRFFENMDLQEASLKRSISSASSLDSDSATRKRVHKPDVTENPRRQASVVFSLFDEKGIRRAFDEDASLLFPELYSAFGFFNVIRETPCGRIILDFPWITVANLEKILQLSVFDVKPPSRITVDLLSTYGVGNTVPEWSAKPLNTPRMFPMTMSKEEWTQVTPLKKARGSGALSAVWALGPPSPAATPTKPADSELPEPPAEVALPPAVPTSASNPEAKKKVRKRGSRIKFLPLDYSKVEVSVPPPDKLTILYRPTDAKCDLSKVHQGNLFKELSKVSTPSKIRNLRGGAIAVDFPPNTTTEPLLALSTLTEIPVKASLPEGLACRTGVIKGLHPEVSDKEFIEEASSDIPITGFSRLAKPGCTSWVVRLYFQGTSLPKNVKYAGRVFKVSTYMKKTIQCEKCFTFGHASKYCRTGVLCPQCSEKHELVDCPAKSATCKNCKGPHLATDPSCPARSFAAKVTQVRANSCLSASEAKGAVKRAARSYAEAVTSKPQRERPEPSQNNIYNRSASPSSTANLTADIVAAVLEASRKKDYDGLIAVLEALLKTFIGAALPEGTLRQLIAARTPPPLPPLSFPPFPEGEARAWPPSPTCSLFSGFSLLSMA